MHRLLRLADPGSMLGPTDTDGHSLHLGLALAMRPQKTMRFLGIGGQDFFSNDFIERLDALAVAFAQADQEFRVGTGKVLHPAGNFLQPRQPTSPVPAMAAEDEPVA